MDKRTLENVLINMSQAKFDHVCRIVLMEYYKIDATNVDGKGDRGGDYVVLPTTTGVRTFICQTTVQDKNWKGKLAADAKKAVNTLNCKRFLALLSRRHESGELRDLENQITTDWNIPASVLGAVEIADILVSKKLYGAVLSELGLVWDASFTNRPSSSEALMLATATLSDHSSALKEQVYEDAIIMALECSSNISRSEIIRKVLTKLQCGEHREARINARIDALLVKGKLKLEQQTKNLILSEQTKQDLGSARAIYTAQFEKLALDLGKILAKYRISNIPKSSLEEIAVLGARNECLTSIRKSSADGLKIESNAILDQFGNPYAELQRILRNHGCSEEDAELAIFDLIQEVRTQPLVLRLCRNVLFFALDGLSPITQVRALGVSTWRDVTVVLDTSVAIPYLCAKYSSPSSGRFSSGASAGIEALRNAGARIVISKHYLNEASTHLIKAIYYCTKGLNIDVRKCCGNGFVSHHAQLAESGRVPKSLIEFITGLSPSLKYITDNNLVPRVTNDLAKHFTTFDITIIDQALDKLTASSDIRTLFDAEHRKASVFEMKS